MPVKTIDMSGGLVDSKDPSLLAEGELSRADDIVYRPNDPAIHKAPGRKNFNPTQNHRLSRALRSWSSME